MKGRRWTAEQKMAIVLEGLKGEFSIAELCRKHEIDQSQYYRWRERFFEGGKAALENGEASAKERQLKERIRELERIVGKLTVQNEILKKVQGLEE